MVRIREPESFESHTKHGGEHCAGAIFVDIDDNFSGLAFHKNIVREDGKKQESCDLNETKDKPKSGTLFS